MLNHGSILYFLLLSTLIPFVKDNLAEIKVSDNYRAIRGGSLLFKGDKTCARSALDHIPSHNKYKQVILDYYRKITQKRAKMNRGISPSIISFWLFTFFYIPKGIPYFFELNFHQFFFFKKSMKEKEKPWKSRHKLLCFV